MGAKASKRGIFEGDIDNGELEIGQIVSTIKEIRPVSAIMASLIDEYRTTKANIATLKQFDF